MTIRFRVLESFDGEPAQNDDSLSVVPYSEYVKLQEQIEVLTMELQATRELAFQDGYKSASSEARGLVEQYYQRLADNMVTRVSLLESKIDDSAKQVSEYYGHLLYIIVSQLLPRYVMNHAMEDFIEKISEILQHNDERKVIISANEPMIERLLSMSHLPENRVEWRMDNKIHDGEIEGTWDKGGHALSVNKILNSVDEILTSSLNIEPCKVQSMRDESSDSKDLYLEQQS